MRNTCKYSSSRKYCMKGKQCKLCAALAGAAVAAAAVAAATAGISTRMLCGAASSAALNRSTPAASGDSLFKIKNKFAFSIAVYSCAEVDFVSECQKRKENEEFC